MNQFAFAFGALVGVFCAAAAFLLLWPLWRRRTTEPSGYDATRQAAFDQWPTSALVLDPVSQKIVTANPAAIRNLGYSLDEMGGGGVAFTDVFSAEGIPPKALVPKLREATSRTPIEMRQRSKDGTAREVEATCYPLMLGDRRMLAVAVHDFSGRRDAETQLRERHQQLDHLAHHDPLTGLPNRLFLAANLPGAIDEARNRNTELAVLFLDLDRFKHVNDSRGHETGDKLLKTVAQRVRATMRAQDLVVRMGGDEFVVVMKDIVDTQQVRDAATRITHALSAPMVIDGRTLVTTVSIGVAFYPHDAADMGELLRHSDTAMYRPRTAAATTSSFSAPAWTGVSRSASPSSRACARRCRAASSTCTTSRSSTSSRIA